MSSLEWNKVAAALLTAGVIAMFAGFVADIAFHQEALEENVYVAAVVEDAGETAGEAAEDTGPEPIVPLLAAADVSSGESITKKCTACHSFEQGGPNKIGPNLWDVVNRQIAGVADFSYSNALQEKSDQEWTYANLNGFLAKPKEWAPGTKMSFAGLGKTSDRADLIAYLRTLSEDPAPLPTAEEVAQATASEAEGADPDAEGAAGSEPGSGMADRPETPVEQRQSDADAQAAAGAAGGLGAAIQAVSAEDGKKVARKCAACHSFDEGGPNKIGPNLYGVIGQPIAAAEGFKYSNALKEKAGEWTYADLSAFLENPKGWAPGTKMSFAGLKKQEDRAAILAYLREMHGNPPPLPE